MSFIEEKRAEIMENNTAQSDFMHFLENLDPSVSEIVYREPLSGDLDFEVLQKCNFGNIVSFQFSPGNITSLRNIPEGITRILCAENFLLEFPDLPDSIIEADFRQNAIKVIGERIPANLKELNVSMNHLQTIDRLPADLLVLKCESNQLRVLNLAGVDHLRTLHCSNNPLLIIEHMPDTVRDLVMDNDVITAAVRGAEEGESEASGASTSGDSAERRADYSECLQTYFQIKKTYDNRLFLQKREIYKKAKSKKAAKTKMQELKPKCIQCARPVGTIFKRQERMYIARCGDEKSPCTLDIQLFSGEYAKINEMIEIYKSSVEFTKQQINSVKLDVLFNYLSEADGVELFKDNIEYYTTENVHYTTLEKEYGDLYFSEERAQKILDKERKIQRIRERIGEMDARYREEQNSEILRDAMAMYINELIPEMENLQIIKYDLREMIDKPDGTKELFMTPWRINQLEYTFGEYPRVVKYRYKEN